MPDVEPKHLKGIDWFNPRIAPPVGAAMAAMRFAAACFFQ
jgi:hypothetical protein